MQYARKIILSINSKIAYLTSFGSIITGIYNLVLAIPRPVVSACQGAMLCIFTCLGYGHGFLEHDCAGSTPGQNLELHRDHIFSSSPIARELVCPGTCMHVAVGICDGLRSVSCYYGPAVESRDRSERHHYDIKAQARVPVPVSI